MQFEILGPFRVADGAAVRATKPRRLLATLLLHHGRTVSVDQLTDVLWDGPPPRSAIANLRTYVLTLRDVVPGIVTETGGYRLSVPESSLDAAAMARHAASAAELRRAGDTAGALAAYRAAHALWRGAPLEDLTPCAGWQPALARLNRLRHTVSDGLTELSLAAGDHATAHGLLRERLAEDPYDEDRWAQLVRSLHVSGRVHAARTAYREAVTVLEDELGVAPGEELRAAGALVTPRLRSVSLDDTLDRSVAAAARLPYRYFGVPVGESIGTAAPAEGPDDSCWLRTMAPNLVETLRGAAARGEHEQVWRLAAAWSPYFDLRGPFRQWRAVHELALASARACRSRRGIAIILRDLGQLAMYRDDWAAAHRAFTAAGRAFEALGDPHGVAVATVGLGTWHRDRGAPDLALARYETALTTFVRLGDEAGEAVARNAIGSVWLGRKETGAAETWLSSAYELSSRIGDEHRRAQILGRLAKVRFLRGEHGGARADLRAAQGIFAAIDDHRCAEKLSLPA
jgi:DNA-binding SARP family transcriptional activator